jgi:NAD+ synthase (glutamine-hydrolysing)
MAHDRLQRRCLDSTDSTINRHKSTIITPSIHLCPYNPDDNRHDLRPFLYVVDWPWQFGKIRAHVEQLEAKLTEKKDVD